MKSVLVPMAKGFEEIELVSIVDVLRRAGVRVVIASLDSHKRVLGSHHIVMEADSALPELEMEHFEAIVLAGGYAGMQNLAQNELIKLWLTNFKQEGKIVAAICASPIVLDKAGVLDGVFTCFPGCENEINMQGKTRSEEAIVHNANVITSTAPATAIIFAIYIVQELCGKEKAKELYDSLQVPILKNYLHTTAY